MGLKELLTIAKATRVGRTITVVPLIIVASAFAGHINIDLLFFGIACALLYSGFGLHNALRDGDYDLPGYTKVVIVGFCALAFIVSLKNIIITLTCISWLLLGYFYNRHSRYFILGDVTTLAVTHHALPALSAFIIAGVDLRT